MKLQLDDNGQLTLSDRLVWDPVANVLRVFDTYVDELNNSGWSISGNSIQYKGSGPQANNTNAYFGNICGGGVYFKGTFFAPTAGSPELGSLSNPWSTIYTKDSILAYNYNMSSIDYERGRFGFSKNELHVGVEWGGTGNQREAFFGSFSAGGTPLAGFKTWGMVANRLSFFVRDPDDAEIVLTDVDLRLATSHVLGWVERGNANEDTLDVGLARRDIGELEVNTGKRGNFGNLRLKRLVAHESLRVYSMKLDKANYERARVGWNGTTLEIGAEAGGFGLVRDVKLLGRKIIVRVLQLTPVALGALPLPNLAGAGARAHINDAIDVEWGVIAAGGGYLNAPVWSDGESWRIG